MPARRRFNIPQSNYGLVIPEEKYHNLAALSASRPNKATYNNNNNPIPVLYSNECLEEQDTEPELIMTGRDRTAEFTNTIQTLQGRSIAWAVAARDVRKSRAIQSHSEFMLVAKNIGKNLSSTYSKLEKLTLLAKRRSLFDDRTTEIQELTYIIKGDLGSLNQQIAKLQEVSKRQQQHTSNGKHLLSHASSIVLTLQSKLATMSTDFKQILQVRTDNLKEQKSRRDQFSHGSVTSTMPPSVAQNHTSSVLLQEQDQVSINLDNTAVATQPLIARSQNQMQVALMHDQTGHHHYLASRAETMQNIESTIVELGGIFQQLAHMVKEQEEMVDRIDSNVENAELNIEAAHAQILKYFQSVTSNRWLMIKIFAVLIFFFVFFVAFMA